ncbi:M23 family metallopeptidase [Alteribacter aurantiacus]|uniref:M23 family metallopeptidase n=1 Tax=Alteribacter aurantiacus TaxID=254410 RepID=UPI0003F7B0EB|nr:M23 family metallopeptidase [Alteribacter aurantiacus]
MFKQKKSYKKTFTYIIMLLVFGLVTTVYSLSASAHIMDEESIEEDEGEGVDTIYHVHYGDTFVGFVDDKSDVYEIVDEKVDEINEDEEDLRLTPEEKLQVIPERVFQVKAINDVTTEKLEDMLEIKAEALTFTVDDVEIGYMSAAFDKEDFIRFWALEYVDEDVLEAYEDEEDVELDEGDMKILDMYLSEEVEVEETLVDPAELSTKEELVEAFETGALEESEYEVQEGDVLGSIARQHDLSVKELLDANDDLDEDSSIRVGDTLEVQNESPAVQLVIEVQKKESKDISYDTKTEEDDEMEKGETKVKESGEKGEKIVESKVVLENGSTASTDVIEEEVVSEPEDRVVIKGTKESDELAWPAVGGYISSHQGPRWGRFHKGIDIARPSSPEIRAAESGTVTSARYENGYGNTIRIRHSNGLETLYAHLDSMDVSSGDKVSRGEDIGIMGETGNSTGVHLHFEVYKDGELENPTDYVSK